MAKCKKWRRRRCNNKNPMAIVFFRTLDAANFRHSHRMANVNMHTYAIECEWLCFCMCEFRWYTKFPFSALTSVKCFMTVRKWFILITIFNFIPCTFAGFPPSFFTSLRCCCCCLYDSISFHATLSQRALEARTATARPKSWAGKCAGERERGRGRGRKRK